MVAGVASVMSRHDELLCLRLVMPHCMFGMQLFLSAIVKLTESACPPGFPYILLHSFYPLPLQAIKLQRSLDGLPRLSPQPLSLRGWPALGRFRSIYHVQASPVMN